MKKIITLFFTVLFLGGMTSFAQEQPCVDYEDAFFGTPTPTSGGNCSNTLSFTLLNDVSDPNAKYAFVEVFIESTGQVIASGCYQSGPRPAGVTYVLPISSYPCTAVLKWRVTRYTASNPGGCQGGKCGPILILPLKLTKFTAQKKSTGVQLDWLVVAEMVQDGESFELERSFPDGIYSPIQKIDAVTSKGSYSYTDVTVPIVSGKVLYRLAMYDNSGKKQYSNVLPVSFGTDVKPKIISKPHSGLITIADMPVGTSVSVASVNGVVLFKDVKIFGTTSLDITNAPAGVYFVTYITKEKSFTEKIIR